MKLWPSPKRQDDLLSIAWQSPSFRYPTTSASAAVSKGAGLRGKGIDATKSAVVTTLAEQSAPGKLSANWRTLIKDRGSGQMEFSLHEDR
jgi:hypothetical protein